MKHPYLKVVIVCIATFLVISNLFAQESKNILLGKIYTKSASADNISTLNFTSSNSGKSYTVANVLGKNYESSIFFNYKIEGEKVTITYENFSDKEVYNIDLASGKLISTHLEGYVDGKWGKVFWVEKK